ncbi:MAG: LTA synthase family protein [Firmicutes bacterium]|nr:LTA synthase family protein [Bacillota bacterium]
MKKGRNKNLHIVLLMIITIIFVAAGYLKVYFSKTNFEEIIFYVRSGLDNGDMSVFWYAVKVCLPFIIVLFTIFYSLFYEIPFKKEQTIIIKNKKIYPVRFFKEHVKGATITLFVLSLCSISWSVNLLNYVIYTNFPSNFIEENYVNPKETEIRFDEKRNLIMIYVESLETSLFTKEQGGYWKYDVIPELYKIYKDDDTVVFYDKDISQTSNMIQGSSWTTASLVANSSGVPFKIRINKNGYHSKNFLNGSYTLGDLLEDNGYYNELISGATTSFGGLKEFYKRHGNYNIIDKNTLKKYDLKMKKDDKGKWGFNDKYLFEVAKKRLDVISKQDEPFNLNLVSIDTHFVDGFVGNYSETKYKEQYENAYATTSRLIYDFVEWVKMQPYYENTTIVIMGDHLSMQDEFFFKHRVKDRYVYNCIINPRNNIGKQKNRVITALDTYPTVVSAIGGNIKGNKLGLGVNLFSKEKTLAEKLGVKKLDRELRKKSKFYNDNILNDEYLKKFELDKKVGS